MDERCYLYVSLIRMYADHNILDPKNRRDWHRYQWTISTERWAVDELISRVLDEYDRLPPFDGSPHAEPAPIDQIVHEFIDEMEYYSIESSRRRTEDIFNVARDVALDVLAYLQIYLQCFGEE